MSVRTNDVNPKARPAPLRNVRLFLQLCDQVVNGPRHLQRIGVFHGFSGLGKTIASIQGEIKYDAVRVECFSEWTKKDLLDNIVFEMTAQKPGRMSNNDRAELILQLLHDEERLLIIDEADHIATRGNVDAVRGIIDRSDTPMILIGMELLPQKLKKYELFDNRVMQFQAAMPSDLNDANLLTKMYAPHLDISEALIARLVDKTGGITRRIVNNLNRISEEAALRGIQKVGSEHWPDERIFNGNVKPRNFLRGQA